MGSILLWQHRWNFLRPFLSHMQIITELCTCHKKKASNSYGSFSLFWSIVCSRPHATPLGTAPLICTCSQIIGHLAAGKVRHCSRASASKLCNTLPLKGSSVADSHRARHSSVNEVVLVRKHPRRAQTRRHF